MTIGAPARPTRRRALIGGELLVVSRAPGARILRGVLRRERRFLLGQLPGYPPARPPEAPCRGQSPPRAQQGCDSVGAACAEEKALRHPIRGEWCRVLRRCLLVDGKELGCQTPNPTRNSYVLVCGFHRHWRQANERKAVWRRQQDE